MTAVTYTDSHSSNLWVSADEHRALYTTMQTKYRPKPEMWTGWWVRVQWWARDHSWVRNLSGLTYCEYILTSSYIHATHPIVHDKWLASLCTLLTHCGNDGCFSTLFLKQELHRNSQRKLWCWSLVARDQSQPLIRKKKEKHGKKEEGDVWMTGIGPETDRLRQNIV